MKRYLLVYPALALIGLLLVPVVVKHAAEKPAHRSLAFTRLADTAYRDVSFANTQAGIRLAGMLFVPEGRGPFPAAVIIHGSGTSQRESAWYVTLAHDLQQRGIAVLLPDKRGSERSEGDWRTASFQDLASDTVAAVNFLRTQSDVPISRIGIIGLSQGGHIAPLVATQAEKLAFVVNMVGGALPMHDALLYEENHNLRELGVLPGFSDLLAYPGAWSLIHWRQKGFWNAIGNFDPLPYWRRVGIPALVLYGGDDPNVDSAASERRLRAIDNPNIRVIVYPGSGHALESPEGQGDQLIRPEALEAIGRFIHAAAGKESQAMIGRKA